MERRESYNGGGMKEVASSFIVGLMKKSGAGDSCIFCKL